jgi:hypothetical protein
MTLTLTLYTYGRKAEKAREIRIKSCQWCIIENGRVVRQLPAVTSRIALPFNVCHDDGPRTERVCATWVCLGGGGWMEAMTRDILL